LPRLIVPGVRLAELVANSRKTRPEARQAFHNRDLGEAYAPSEHRLSITQIRDCVEDDVRLLPSLRSDRLVVLGCDVASTRALNVVIEEVLDRDAGRRVFVGEIEDGPDGTAFEQLCALMNRYSVTIAGIDRAPERRFSAAFVNAFPGRACMIGYYAPAPGARIEASASRWDDESRVLTVWRTIAIDATLERFRSRLVTLPPLDTLPADYPAHLGNVVRQVTETSSGPRAEYRSIGPDDYLHAETYLLAARELMFSFVERRPDQIYALAPALLDDPVDLTSPAGLEVYRPGFDDGSDADPFGYFG
jgi:hypothetical protein